MSLQTNIENDLINAQKEKKEFLRDTLRYLKSALKNAAIAKREELNDDEVINILQKEIKQRKEAASQYTTSGRPELAKKEEDEARILEAYLPKQLSDDQLIEIVQSAISQTGASEPKDMGKVMSIVMPEVQGKADGSRVSNMTKELLSHE